MTRPAMPCASSDSAALIASKRVTPAPTSVTLSASLELQRLAAADGELLVGAVEQVGLFARGADVGDAFEVRHLARPAAPWSCRRRDRGRWSRGRRASWRGLPAPSATGRPRQSIRRHGSRRGAGLARPTARHAHEVVGTRQESAEGGGEGRLCPATCRPTAAPTMFCSAMNIWKKRSGQTLSKSSV